eukprot:gnl/TRDRNA2_/TRDRNA2_176878_c0_seq2.p1 gnl/TRDRNA2_/TRDRNA2_176878_c0~~gnl/TRDRNA2_/TRDRNA2_176878_c0_seq2.p1  ORF type:complete len:554 (-),score=123.56 gnl/TRDRNA2_/TRDRNA2_176878_c0_seq2:148-1809(-)
MFSKLRSRVVRPAAARFASTVKSVDARDQSSLWMAGAAAAAAAGAASVLALQNKKVAAAETLGAQQPVECGLFGGSPKLDPLAFATTMTIGHDLTLDHEHRMYTMLADAFYKDFSMSQLRALEKQTSEKIETTWQYSTLFHIALKDAISKKLMDTLPPIHCTVLFAMYKEANRMVPKGPDVKGVSHPNGEDFIRKKHQQMTWLFENRPDCSWTMMGCDDGCPVGSTQLCEGIVKEMGYKNVSTVQLKKACIEGTCPVLDFKKLKSEAWDPNDALVKASQKGGAIIYGLYEAQKEGAKYPGKEHIIVYTDSDLSTDLRLCGLNFDTIINGKVDCSVSQRFGQPFAVNCGKLVTTGGIAPGMPQSSMVHLTLRHKLRMNLLPPLGVITDTNCGHKAIRGKALDGVLDKVRDYKGSFDMDWLMCVGIASKSAGRKGIGVTAIPWVNSVGESNFWSAPGSGDETPEQAKLKTCTSWHKIFKTMVDMHGWHKEGLEKAGLLTAEQKAYVEFVSKLDVHGYIRMTDAIEAKLAKAGKTVSMPEPTILAMSLDELKKMAA